MPDSWCSSTILCSAEACYQRERWIRGTLQNSEVSWKNRSNDTVSSHTRCCHHQIYFRCTIVLWSAITIKYDFLFHWFAWANGAKINVATNIGLRESVVRLIMQKCAFADNTSQLISSVCPSHTRTHPQYQLKGQRSR